jgi:hypothetical protein
MKCYELSNGDTFWLTSVEGQPESISLSSKPWTAIDFSMDDIGVLRDEMGNPAVFIKKDDISYWLGHEFIVDLLLGEPIRPDAITSDYPNMLPNNKSLSLGFAVDMDIPKRPIFWPPIS